MGAQFAPHGRSSIRWKMGRRGFTSHSSTTNCAWQHRSQYMIGGWSGARDFHGSAISPSEPLLLMSSLTCNAPSGYVNYATYDIVILRGVSWPLVRLSLVFFQQSRQAGRNPYTPFQSNTSILIFLLLLLMFEHNERISVPIWVRAAGRIGDVNIEDAFMTAT